MNQPKPKRPAHRPVSVGAVRRTVTLSKATAEAARRIGNGNLSAGLRIAVKGFDFELLNDDHKQE